ncbi:uncharacterized protein ACIQIH_011006 isoform 3-T8 [Cyanocitta cristata]
MAVAEMPSFPAGPRDRQSEEMCLVIMLEADMQLHRQTFCKIRGILTMNYGETISRRIPNPPRIPRFRGPLHVCEPLKGRMKRNINSNDS